jgi:hypothetical protein
MVKGYIFTSLLRINYLNVGVEKNVTHYLAKLGTVTESAQAQARSLRGVPRQLKPEDFQGPCLPMIKSGHPSSSCRQIYIIQKAGFALCNLSLGRFLIFLFFFFDGSEV